MWNYNYSNELYHYGVLGMRWGVRKTAGVRSGSIKTRRSQDSVNAKKLKRKGINKLTNQELKELNNRMQLEQTQRELSSKANLGKRSVQTFIKTAGTMTAVAGAYAVYKGPATKIINKVGRMIIHPIH